MDVNIKKRITIFLSLFVMIVLVVSAFYILFFNNQNNSGVVITNQDQLPKDISNSDLEEIKTSILNYLKDNYDQFKDSTKEEITIRDKSYSQDEKDNVLYSSFIVDIPESKVTFKVNYNWSKNKQVKVNNPITVMCPQPFELVYGKDSCLDQSNSKTDSVDPILSSLPYNNDYYTIVPVKDSSGKLTLRVESTGISRALTEKDYRKMVSEWLSRKGVNPNDYTIFISMNSKS